MSGARNPYPGAKLGVVEAGAWADLLVVDGNPLEDIRLLEDPARNLRLVDRGEIRAGAFADLVVFDPARIADRATWAQPHQFAVGVDHVIVNGQPVLRDGRLTGARPGRVVRGPGWQKPAHAASAGDGLVLPRAAG